jgi:hypothetical protein
MTAAQPISHENALAMPDAEQLGPERGVLFLYTNKTFLMRRSSAALEARYGRTPNETSRPSVQGQATTQRDDVLVRLPSLREAEWRITVLQRWVGRVQRVGSNKFLAIITDATNPHHPPENVKLDIDEVSGSDRALLCEGAAFYWSIGYRDTIGGQRERISALRFVRQPHLRQPDVDRILAQADQLATFLESD